MSNDMDVPFEKGPDGQTLDLSAGNVAGGLVVLACVVPLDGGGSWPGLAFRFAKPDGSGFYPPTVLAVTPDQIPKTVELVSRAADAALAAHAKS